VDVGISQDVDFVEKKWKEEIEAALRGRCPCKGGNCPWSSEQRY
jgi:hypothetical protein